MYVIYVGVYCVCVVGGICLIIMLCMFLCVVCV